MEMMVGAEGSPIGETVKDWFEKNIGEEFNNKFSAMGFINKNEIKAAAIFDNYTGNNIDFHYYGPRISRGNYRKILDYVFNFLKCNRLTTIPHREHTKTLVILPRLGFLHEATLKNYYGVDGSKDALVYVITKDRAKYWIEIT